MITKHQWDVLLVFDQIVFVAMFLLALAEVDPNFGHRRKPYFRLCRTLGANVEIMLKFWQRGPVPLPLGC